MRKFSFNLLTDMANFGYFPKELLSGGSDTSRIPPQERARFEYQVNALNENFKKCLCPQEVKVFLDCPASN